MPEISSCAMEWAHGQFSWRGGRGEESYLVEDLLLFEVAELGKESLEGELNLLRVVSTVGER
jgi:hypothetical protein